MSGIACFMLEPTDRVRRSLRRFQMSRWDETLGRSVYADPCPANGDGGHDASVEIGEAAVEWGERDGDAGAGLRTYYRGDTRDFPRDDPRWPTHCACGYAFQPGDYWQANNQLIYRRADGGGEYTLRDAPPGALWWAPWMDGCWREQLAHTICVRLPDGTDWFPDMQAQNCTMPDDRAQERHHCWTLSGTPPNLTVDKSGPTCAAGAGSIQTPRYHGFLRGGELTGA